MAGSVKIAIIGDAKGFSGAAGEAEGALGRLGGAVASFAANAVAQLATVGARAMKQFADDTIRAASDLSESMSKSTVVFTDQADEIQAWAESAATAMGMSQQQALEAAGTYGNLFQAFGIGSEESADMSTSLVQLASDLASFNNANPEDVLIALRAGLSGETEPLKRFGIAINQARIESEALALGLLQPGQSLLSLDATTQQQIKTQAAYSIIMKDSTLAQGDYARTADGMANSQRTLKATVEDLKASLGDGLLGPATIAVQAFADALPKLEPMLTKLWDNGFAPLLESLGPALDTLIPALEPIIGAITSLAAAAGPVISRLLEGIAPVLGSLGEAAQRILVPLEPLAMMFADVAAEILPPLADVLVVVADAISTALMPIMEELGPVIKDVATQLGGSLGEIVVALTPTLLELAKALGEFAPVIPPLVELSAVMLPLVTEILVALSPYLADLAKAIAIVAGAVAQVMAAGLEHLVNLFSAIFAGDWDAAGAEIERFWTLIRTKIDEWMPKIREAAGKILDAIVSAFQENAPKVLAWLGEEIPKWAAWLGEQIPQWAAKGLELLGGLLWGLIQKLPEILGWLFEVGELALGALGDLSLTLAGKGLELLGGLLAGLVEKGLELGDWFLDLPGQILVWVGDIARLLFDAGVDLVQGFIDGIGDKVGEVQSVLGDLTSKLTSWKGPESLDRVILRPAGQAVIGGFVAGLRDAIPDVERTLSGVTGDIASTNLRLAATNGRTVAGSSSASRGGPLEVAVYLSRDSRRALAREVLDEVEVIRKAAS